MQVKTLLPWQNMGLYQLHSGSWISPPHTAPACNTHRLLLHTRKSKLASWKERSRTSQRHKTRSSRISDRQLAPQSPTVRVVDRVPVVDGDGSRVELDSLLVVALLEFLVAQVLGQNASYEVSEKKTYLESIRIVRRSLSSSLVFLLVFAHFRSRKIKS